MMRFSLAVGGLLSLLAAPAAAQVTVRGQLTDSLATRAFVGARVQLVSSDAPWTAGRSTTSDSLGHFVFDSVVTGTYTVGFTHPRLDSLGMDAVQRTIAVSNGVTQVVANLALPSARTLAVALCGPRHDTTGVIIGRARDARTGLGRAAARVTASWGELVMDTKAMRTAAADVRTVSSADGRYVLCGVPTDVAVLLQARSADSASTDSSGAIEVAFAPNAPLLHRDMWLADSAAGNTRIAGRVLRPDGSPLTGARVRVRGAPRAGVVVTDSSGGFVLVGAPAGSQTIEAIAIGYAPTRVPLDVRSGGTSPVTLSMHTQLTTLETVTVRAVMSRETQDYLARAKRRGLGYFFSGNDVRRRGEPFVGSALLRVPGLRLIETQNGRPVLSGPFRCRPRFFLDGWEIEGDDLERFASVTSLGAIEAYRLPSEVPPQLMRGLLIPTAFSEPCVMVFVWSRSVVDPG